MEKKEKQNNLEKYCYDYWKRANWNTNKLESLIGRGGIDSIKTARLLAKAHAEKIGISEDDFYYEIIQANGERVPRKERKYQKIFEELSDVDREDREKIIKIVSKYQTERYFKAPILKTFVRSYTRFFRENEKEQLETDLQEKIELYRLAKEQELKDEMKKEKQEKEMKEEDKTKLSPEEEKHYYEVIKQFINSDKSKQNFAKEYSKKTGIPIPKISSYIKLAEKIDNLTERKEKHLQEQKQNKYKENEEDITTILEFLKTGVSINEDKPRKFNLLDYYTITKMNPVEMSKLINGIVPKNDYIDFMKQITNESARDIEADEEKKLNETYKVLNKEGKLIEMTQEDTQYVLNYLKANEIPLTEKIYTQAVKRYVDLELDDLKKTLQNKNNKKR